MTDWYDKLIISIDQSYNSNNICIGGGVMANDRFNVSDKTAISMPMRNLLSILAATAIGVYAFFGIQDA